MNNSHHVKNQKNSERQRERREANALRDNLKRRKAQQKKQTSSTHPK